MVSRLLLLTFCFFSAASATAGQCPVAGKPNLCVRGKATNNTADTTEEACCAACVATPGCAAWQLSPDRGSRPCSLKPSAEHTGAGNCTSGILHAPPPGPSPSPPGPSPSRGLSFSHLFTGGAVLQMDTEAQVWGAAPPGAETVSVFLNGKLAATSPVNHSAAPLDRAWSVRLPPQKAQYDVEMSVSSGSSNATVLVHFGQVVLCSGQVRVRTCTQDCDHK